MTGLALDQAEVVVRVKDLMTENLVTVNADDSVMEAAKLMSEKGISSLIVSHEKEFQGIITDRDILSRVVSKRLDPSRVRVGDVESSPLVTIDEQATIEEAAKKMRENNVRRLVVERTHRKVGIMAESDIVRVNPELHYLIRERSKLQATLTPSEPRKVVLAGYCEECGNYSPRLRNINGRWLDEEC